MRNLNHRLKRLEDHAALSTEDQKKMVYFFRSFPGIISESERLFYERTPNLEDYKILIILWYNRHNPYRDFTYERYKHYTDMRNPPRSDENMPYLNSRLNRLNKIIKGAGKKEAFFIREDPDVPSEGEKKFYETTPNVDEYTVCIYSLGKANLG